MQILSIFFSVAIFCFTLNLQKQLQQSCSETTRPCRPSFNGLWSPANILLAGFNVCYRRGWNKKKKKKVWQQCETSCEVNTAVETLAWGLWKPLQNSEAEASTHTHTLTSSHPLFLIKIVPYLWLKSTRVKIRTKSVFLTWRAHVQVRILQLGDSSRQQAVVSVRLTCEADRLLSDDSS